MIIEQTWFKCENKECGCTWYDDCFNAFHCCPECGNLEFEILEEEILEFEDD